MNRIVLLFLCVTQMALALDIQLFRPHGDRYEGVNNFGSSTFPIGVIQTGAYVNYVNRPANFSLTPDASSISGAVESFVNVDAVLNIGLTKFLSIGANIPFQIDSQISPIAGLTEEDDLSFGDALFHATLQFINSEQSGFGLAVIPFFTLPLNDNTQNFVNNSGYTLGGRIVMDYWMNNTYASLNLGAKYRSDTETFVTSPTESFSVDHEALYGLTLVQYFGDRKTTDVFVELYGNTQLDSPFSETELSPLEAVAGLRHRLLDETVTLSLGGGTGIIDAYASPKYRLFAGLLLTTKREKAPAPQVIEELPIQPVAQPIRTPAAKPKIGQLVIHIRDEKNQPIEAQLKIQEVTGAGQFEDLSKLWKKNIKSGIYQITATKEGYTTVEKRITLRANKRYTDKIVMAKAIQEGQQISVLGKILFESGKASIRPESFMTLTEVAKTLNQHPEIQKVRIEAHSDSVGSAALNLKLSTQRAASVMQSLVERGINPNRLISVGLGEAQPIAPNTTPQGRALNRRVEFTILKSSGTTKVKVQR